VEDDRLRLIFTCCHPALSAEARVALTLRLLGGLSTEEVARSFLVPEPTMAQRLVRAKHKIKAARIPYRVPAEHELPDRLMMLGMALGFAVGYLYGSERAREETRRLFANAPEPVRQATTRVSDAIAAAPVPDVVKQATTRASTAVQEGTERAARAAASSLDASQARASEVVDELADSLPRDRPEAPSA
jgi:hypothetical protein